jgi:RNA polymerase sigma-70 factor (sigma-E family)
MPQRGRYAEFAAFYNARGDDLLRTAMLLAQGRQSGEDLLQESLERLLRKWHRIDGNPEGYLRRIMYNLAIDGWRRRSRRPEVLGAVHDAAAEDHAAALDERLVLAAALARLTPRQRSVVVARYWEHLSEAETAQAVGCSVGAVKQATARALIALRKELGRENGEATMRTGGRDEQRPDE